MDEDEQQHKATPVTKSIELKQKNIGSAGMRGTELHSSSSFKLPGEDDLSSCEQPRRLAGVSVLPVSRRQKENPRPEIVEQIGHRLSSIYKEVLSQPVPDRFLDLLAELESGEQPARTAGASSKKGRT